MSQSQHHSSRSLNVFLLTMINIATILSVRNWPLTAEYGFASVFFILLAVLLFLVPVGLVSAELATGWPKKGGVFVWVREAFGHHLGFLSVWLLWIENVIWYPIILSFIAGSLAYVVNPALADNKLYMYLTILTVFWLCTLLNLRGMKTSGWISSVGVIFGTFIPGTLIIALGFLWYFSGRPTEITLSWGTFFPDFNSFAELAFLAGMLLGFAGLEMPAVHANDVKNPQKDYPKAIFLSTLVIMVFSILGTLSIAIVIPQEKINLVTAGIDAIAYFLAAYRISWLLPLIAILIAIGSLGGVSTWVVGPCKGLLAAAENGDLPPLCHYTNKRGMPTVMMILQALIVSILSSVFLFMPSINSSFWILSVLAIQLYLIMYILMFVTAIVLRYKHPRVTRPYKIPGGNLGMWIVSSIGLLSSSFCMVMGFFPPSQIETGNLLFFELFLVIGIVLFCSMPFLILRYRKPTWQKLGKDLQ